MVPVGETFRVEWRPGREAWLRAWVVCPSCGGRAGVRWYVNETKKRLYNDQLRGVHELRLTCGSCGLSKIAPISGRHYERPPSMSLEQYNSGNPPFDAPLWLRADCCGETLWALNEEHLDYIEAYVAETQRNREFSYRPWLRIGRSKGLAGKLPTWMKLAKNRDEVLRTIERLRATL